MKEFIIVGVYMHREKDKDLLDYLGSKRNRSEYIRDILYKDFLRQESSLDVESSNIKEILNKVLESVNELKNNLSSDNGLHSQYSPISRSFDNVNVKDILINKEFIQSDELSTENSSSNNIFYNSEVEYTNDNLQSESINSDSPIIDSIFDSFDSL